MLLLVWRFLKRLECWRESFINPLYGDFENRADVHILSLFAYPNDDIYL